MLSLLLAVAILVGISSTERMGEQGVAPMIIAEARLGDFGAEALYTHSAKVETGDGWLARGAVDYWDGPLSVGLGYTRRETSKWAKNVMWVRAGIKHGKLRLVTEVAPLSDYMEAKAEARLTLAHKWMRVEPRAFVGWHRMAEELGGYSYGLSLLAGWGR